MTEQPPDPSLRPLADPAFDSQPSSASSGVDFGQPESSPGLSDRPEVAIAGTFVGGLVLATILKRLAR